VFWKDSFLNVGEMELNGLPDTRLFRLSYSENEKMSPITVVPRMTPVKVAEGVAPTSTPKVSVEAAAMVPVPRVTDEAAEAAPEARMAATTARCLMLNMMCTTFVNQA